MIFNEYFSKDNLNQILNSNSKFKYSYHVTITFNNRSNLENYIKNFNSNFQNLDFKYFAWQCFTSKKFKRADNVHKRRKHIHMILFSNSKIDFNSNFNNKLKIYDTKIKNIDYIDGVIEYIHNGHHIIHDNFYNQNLNKDNSNKRALRDILRSLRSLRSY